MSLLTVLTRCDHTDLRPEATIADIHHLIDDAVCYHTASVCIPPVFVPDAVVYARGRMPVCTVIGFPTGYQTTRIKTDEANEAVSAGADEIDMVIGIGMLKSCLNQSGEPNPALYAQIIAEIASVKRVCGDRILKVIIETCLLTESEKILACHAVSDAGADFIKTSTGFSRAGATLDDVRLLRAHVDNRIRVKAAGGIRTLDFAEELLAAGADRLGASALVALAKKANA